MLNSPVALFLNMSAGVFLRSISMTASDTLDSGMSTRFSATITGLLACSCSGWPPGEAAKIYHGMLDKNPTTSLREEIASRLALLELK